MYTILYLCIYYFVNRMSYNSGLIWWWDAGVQVLEQDSQAKNKLHRADLLCHLDNIR